MIGHNGGPGVADGASWRRHCWTVARAALLPTLPIEEVRLRVARAKALGLDYRTYASVRAASGHDVVAFLFSSNALRVSVRQAALPDDRGETLARLEDVARIALATGRLAPGLVLAANAGRLDDAHAAPPYLAPWARARQDLRQALGRVPGDRVLLVGDMALEAEWAGAARLAGYLTAERYFG
jgi:hypothetical protein